MARLNSFFFPAEYWPSMIGDTAVLKGTEARHMLTVLRTEDDQTVRLFDGKGRDGLFRVKERAKNRALLEAIQLNEYPELDSGLTLAIGWGKSKRRNYVFEKSVELKSVGLAFWEAKRSQGSLPATPKESWTEKCIQAAKQCGSTTLPVLSTVGGVEGLIDFAQDFDACYLAWESDDIQAPLTPAHFMAKRTLVVIGPEGGIEDREAQAFIKAGFEPITLGDTIMRWETAAAYCLSLSWFAQQDMK